MSSNNVETRSVFAAISSAIRGLCAMLVSLFSMADEGIDIAHAAVVTARNKQAVDLSIDWHDYTSNAVRLASVKQTQATEEVEAFIGQDEKRRALVETTAKNLKAVVEAELARIQAQRQQR